MTFTRIKNKENKTCKENFLYIIKLMIYPSYVYLCIITTISLQSSIRHAICVTYFIIILCTFFFCFYDGYMALALALHFITELIEGF